MQKPYGFLQNAITSSYQLKNAIPGQGRPQVIRKCSNGIKNSPVTEGYRNQITEKIIETTNCLIDYFSTMVAKTIFCLRHIMNQFRHEPKIVKDFHVINFNNLEV